MTTDNDSPEILARVTSDIEAAVIVNALAAHGITASTAGGFTAGFRAEAPGDLQVIVRHEDLEDAKKLLAKIERTSTNVDWSQIDVGKPDDG